MGLMDHTLVLSGSHFSSFVDRILVLFRSHGKFGSHFSTVWDRILVLFGSHFSTFGIAF